MNAFFAVLHFLVLVLADMLCVSSDFATAPNMGYVGISRAGRDCIWLRSAKMADSMMHEQHVGDVFKDGLQRLRCLAFIILGSDASAPSRQDQETSYMVLHMLMHHQQASVSGAL